MSYDAMGRLTEASRPGGLVDHYGYDQLGQRTSHWNSFLGASNVERTGYDLQGRVTSQTAFGGDVTATAYAWDGTIANTGMGIYGGWTQTVTYANSKTSIEKSDLFGREVWKQDLGLHVFASAYDRAGRVTSRSGSGDTVSYSWLNTGLAAGGSTTSGTAATYAYDASGNRTAETTTRSGVTVQSATATWDALGRMTAWDEAGNASTPAAHINYAYDAVGNVRRTQATYYQIDSAGNLSVPITQDYWNKFDAMNRLVLAKGGLVDGAIVRGNSGVSVTYDAAGQRITTTRRGKTSEMTWRYTSAGFHTYYHAQDPQYQGPGWAHVAYEYEADRRETFAYNADGTIDTINIAQQQLDYEDGTAQPELGGLGAMGADRLLSDHSYDAMGRLTHQVDYKLGGGAIYDRELTYNAKGQLTLDVASTLQGTATTMKSRTEYTFGSGTGYALGAVVTAAAQNWKNDDDGIAPDTLTTTTYAWWDGAVASSTSYDEDTVNQNNALFTSTYSYDGFGSATGVSIDDGRDRTVTIVNDLNGQAIRRDEADLTSAGDPHEIWYRFGGRQLGYTGNNGTLETDYQTTAQSRTVTQGTGAFRNGATLGASYGDFALGYAPVTSFSDAGGGSHTVQTGETLSSIAANLWGDASLWYKLAEANGMTSANALMEGQSLIVPAGVNRNRYDASTFRPYDPSDAIGDASPTNPKMPKKNKCGTIGQIMIAAVAIAVTAILPHVAGFFATTAGSILGGMIGSAAGQGFGIAIGAQEKFDWKAVAMAGVTAGVSKGLDKLGAFGRVGLAGNGFAAQAARGAITAGLSQGVGVATGLQSKFDFAGVAAAGLSQGVSSRIGGTDLNSKFMRIGADELVSAASRSVLTGTSFGDNLVAVLPSVIGRTIGESIEGALSRRESPINVNSEATFAAAERVFAGLGNEAFTSDFGTSLDGAGIGMGAAFEPVAGAGGGQSSPRAGDVGDSSERETHEDDVIVVNGDRRRATEPAHSSSNGVEVPSYDGIRGGRPNGTNHLAFFLDNLGKDLPGYFQQREYQFFGPGAGDPGRYVAYVDSLASDATEWQFRRIILPVLNGWAGYGAYGEGWSAAAARAREIVAAREAGFNADWNQQLSDFGRAYVQIGQIANPIMAAASGLYDVFNNGVDPIEATTSLLLRRIRFLSNPISGQRERVLTNIAASRRARASSNFSVHVAQTDQTRVGYAADHWEMTNLSAGERIFGGLPGQSPYYTNAATISSSTGSRRALWESLQVRANPELGYRPMVGEYEVIRDIRVPFGTASANPSYGAGGATQFFVRDYGTRLRLVRQLPLGE
jgi:YD repeat-containing protein